MRAEYPDFPVEAPKIFGTYREKSGLARNHIPPLTVDSRQGEIQMQRFKCFFRALLIQWGRRMRLDPWSAYKAESALFWRGPLRVTLT